MESRKEFYLTTHSTHFIYSYMASDIWKARLQRLLEGTAELKMNIQVAHARIAPRIFNRGDNHAVSKITQVV